MVGRNLGIKGEVKMGILRRESSRAAPAVARTIEHYQPVFELGGGKK
jgi:hypothetical protein